jgi:7-cyano-7-deazaguanine synthase in queuosine biosynthesis
MLELLTPVSPIEYAFDFPSPNVVRRTAGGPDGAAEGARFDAGFHVDDESIVRPFGGALEPALADWVDIALMAYVADRLAPRRDPKSPQRAYQWARRIHLKLPVRHPDLWREPHVAGALAALLTHFTDDEWHLEFVGRRGWSRSAKQGYLFASPPSRPALAALQSGGLDSFSGAARHLAEFGDNSFVFVSGATNRRQRSAQREQVRALARSFGRDVCHVTVPFGIDWRGHSHKGVEESSQRTRGFLFSTIGAAAAMAAGALGLHVYENGVGAINLPYNATQLGTSNSRAVHPLSLLRMSDFAEALVGKPFMFQNPFLFRTKGEMCRHPAVRAVAEYIPATFSCDGFPVQAKGKPQCGSCTSCLLRRLSLHAAGLSAFDPAGRYVCDLLDPTSKASERQLHNLRAMEWQYAKIVLRLRAKPPWQSLVTEFHDLEALAAVLASRGLADHARTSRSVLRLYNAYASEWEQFPARGRLRSRARAA